ncbi:MAG: hypothetical protein HRU19_12825 [Pseudobacteriovorax sp.]|nr:hypothetical protein [Pseudobacteriovorax sp.]
MKMFNAALSLGLLFIQSQGFAQRSSSGTPAGQIEYIACHHPESSQRSQPNVSQCTIKLSKPSNSPCPNKHPSNFILVMDGTEHSKSIYSTALLAYTSRKPVYIFHFNDNCTASPASLMQVAGIQIGPN